MSGDYGLRDLLFSGYDNRQLAEQIRGLREGAGSESLFNAVSALFNLARGLAEFDAGLRRQLAEIGVNWEGEAAEGGTAATENSAIYAEDAIPSTEDSAKGVANQGESYSSIRNSAPDASALNGPTEENGVDQFFGFFGHTTDHAQQVRETNEARDAAVAGMTGYQNGSSDALNQYRPLPVPPGMNLVAQPVDTATHSSSVNAQVPTGGLNPTGGPNAGPYTGSPYTGNGPGTPPPTTGGPPPVTGTPPLTTGGPPVNPIHSNPLAQAALRANPMLMAEAATLMGQGAAGGAGAGAERDRLARNSSPKAPLKNGVPLGAAPDDEARAARNAEKFGARTGRPGGSIMQPAAAAGGRSADGEEDQEHVRRYGVDSSDVFDDERVVAPEAIGDDEYDR